MTNKKNFNKLLLLILLISCTLLYGCSSDSLLHSFGQMVGLNMGPDSSDSLSDHTNGNDNHGTNGETTGYVEPLIENINEASDISTNPSNDGNNSDETTTNSTTEAKAEAETEAKADAEAEATPEEEFIWDEENKTYSKTAASPDEITISFAGDVLLSEGCSVLNNVIRNDNDFTKSFDEGLLAHMQDSDIFMLNNEFPYSKGGAPLPGKDFTFRADPAYASILESIGTDIVSLANNHAFDYGPDALDDTFTALRDVKMPYVGAGENINEAIKPAYMKINGRTICIIAATQIEGSMSVPHTRPATETQNGVFRCVDTTQINEVVADAKTKSDFVIIFIHWGTERTDQVREWQKGTAMDLEGAGADLIIGAHSHCLQGIDYVNDTPVFYSLGNYLFNSNSQDTCLVTLTLDTATDNRTTIKSLRFIPCRQGGGKTVLADDDNKARILKYEQGISYHALIDSDGYVTYTEKNMNTQNGQNTSPMRKIEE